MEVNRLEFKGRMVGESLADLRVGQATIMLPTPIITSTAIGYAEELGRERLTTQFSYPQQIHEVKEYWGAKRLKAVMNSPAATGQVIGRIDRLRWKSQADLHAYTPLFCDDVTVTDEIAQFFLTLALETQTNIVNVVDVPSFNLKETGEWFDNAKKQAEAYEGEKDLLFLTKADSNPTAFKEKQELATTKLSGTTTVYADPRRNRNNYAVLAGLAGKPFFRILSNIPKVHPFNERSALLPNSFLFADACSIKLGVMRREKDKKKREEAERRAVTNARRLDELTSGYLTVADHKKEHGENLFCSCPICADSSLTDVSVEFGNALPKAFRAHSEHATFNYFGGVRTGMIDGKLKDYLNEKKFAKTVIEDLFLVGQTKLG